MALLPLTPAEIMQCEKELVEKKKNEHALGSSKTLMNNQLALN
jgi:hypothetical protein